MSDENHTSATPKDLELLRIIREALTDWEEADEWWDDAEWIYEEPVERALASFTSATQLAPDDPWIWFQVGWCSLALEKAERARPALQRVLALDPENVCAHFASAYLLLEFGPFSFDNEFSLFERDPAAVVFQRLERAQSENLEVKVEGLLKDLLQLVSQSEYQARKRDYELRRNEVIWREHLQTVLIAGVHHALSASASIAGSDFRYYHAELGVGLLEKHLEALGETVSEDLRANYYNRVGVALLDHRGWSMGRTQKWFERAIRWESGDPEDLAVAYTHFGEGFFDDMTPPDYLAACQALNKAYSYLMRMPVPADQYWYWLMDVDYLAGKWKPGDDWPTLLRLCDAALDLRPFGDKPPKHVSGADVAPVAEAAGTLLVERGDLARAEPYFLQAKDLDPTRVSVARRLSKLYIDQQRWQEALTEQQRAARLAPADPDAQRLVVVLAVAAMAAKSGLKPELDAIRSGIAELQAGQDLMISLQRDLSQKISDERRRAQLMLKRPLDSIAAERVYADLLDQLHNLVQQGSRVQMAAVRVARDCLIEKLGYEYFSALLPECQHFLVTAETFYATSADIPEQVDAALIAVEYAKVVETELRCRFLRNLGICVDESGYRGHPGRRGRLLCERTGIARNKEDSWEDTFALLTLGSIVRLLRATIRPARNPTVADCVRKLGLKPERIELLVEDVETVRTKYRNGAAHTQRLNRADLDEFRVVLFEQKLLHRLVDIGRRVASSHARL